MKNDKYIEYQYGDDKAANTSYYSPQIMGPLGPHTIPIPFPWESPKIGE